jgi:hypothetical protein
VRTVAVPASADGLADESCARQHTESVRTLNCPRQTARSESDCGLNIEHRDVFLLATTETGAECA